MHQVVVFQDTSLWSMQPLVQACCEKLGIGFGRCCAGREGKGKVTRSQHAWRLRGRVQDSQPAEAGASAPASVPASAPSAPSEQSTVADVLGPLASMTAAVQGLTV